MQRSQAALLCLFAIFVVSFYLLHSPSAAFPFPLRTSYLRPGQPTDVDSTTGSVVQDPQSNTPPPEKAVVVPKLSSENTDWVIQEVPEWSPAIYTVDDLNATLHTSANKGHESLTYLRFIIDNYDRLPDVTAFIHSHKDGYPAAWHNDNDDYSNVVTLKTLRTDFVKRQGFVNLRCNWDPGCPAEIMPFRDPPEESRSAELQMHSVWPILFPNAPLPIILATPCCAQIAVSRDQIRRRPLQDYQRYRQWLLDTELPDDVSGRIMEYLWHVIFGQQPSFCPSISQCYCDLYGQC